jgi:hypothetical protein|tara:strand:- start:106 stop:1290 length:1185 start_codon:yes stop_codon:yes gene_type:complete
MTKKAHQPVSLNIDEAKSFLSHIVTNNRYLQENNKLPVAVEVIGDSGIGKTSMVLQVAKELNLNLVKLNLAQIEELGDLVGFPIRQFEVCQEDKCLWIDEHAVEEYTKLGYKFTGQNRMSYCPPEWIAGKASGGFLLLDDWNRADIRFIQAVMELIDRQTYISWSLPKDWHILLTANPDDGEYLVNSIDTAQKTRFISVNLKFDMKCWGVWAENNQVDGRCINFLLKHPELVSTSVNSRSITTFFNSISSLDSFETNLPLIQMIGEGSVGTEFTTLFTMFINNRLDKMMSPEDMIHHEKEDYVLNTLKGIIGKEKKYRADLASILSTRLVNYSLYYSKENKISKQFIDRLALLMNEELFAVDLKYNIVKSIYNGNQSSFKLLMLNKTLLKFLTK